MVGRPAAGARRKPNAKKRKNQPKKTPSYHSLEEDPPEEDRTFKPAESLHFRNGVDTAFTYHGNDDKTPKAEGLYVYNNLFDGAVNSWGHKMGDVTIVNNTFLGTASVGGDLGRQVFVNNIVHGGGSGTVRSHNTYTALSWSQSPDPRYKWSLAEGEIDWSKKDSNELFADSARGDYRLKAGSASLDAGMDATQYLPISLFPDYDFAKDIDGNPHAISGKWSIGAYGRGERKKEP